MVSWCLERIGAAVILGLVAAKLLGKGLSGKLRV